MSTESTMETVPDRALEDALFWIDVRRAEHAEIDCEAGGEYVCESCAGDRVEARAIRNEMLRRTAAGIRVEDPAAETFEERHAPFGTEWQIEQRERAEGGGW